MKNTTRKLSYLLTPIIALTLVTVASAKPLKVYILAGQSNMEGHAKVGTIDAMRGDPEVTDLHKDMTDKDGKPITVEDVHIVFGERSGKLDASFGSTIQTPKIGPEYAFGIYMNKFTKEPILLIKTAWGGKDLCQQFRPPSAGDFIREVDKHGNKTGHFYREMIKEVRAVLADPGKYHPAYDKQAGVEIAGFVWFQGFNDQFGPYPLMDPNDKDSVRDFSEYGRLLACLIRDVRKDLSAPAMKFVIGAVGFDGVLATEHTDQLPKTGGTWVMLQRAQAAPAAMPEFKDNVSVVYTAKYWDHKLGDVYKAAKKREGWIKRRKDEKAQAGASKEEVTAYRDELYEQQFTKEELKMLKGISNKAFHYLGSAKIYSRIGKAFAEDMVKLEKAK